MNFSSLLQVTGQEKQEKKIAVTYKWSWASVAENRDQAPSGLPRFRSYGRGSAAKRSSLLTVFLQGCLLCKIIVFCKLYFLYAITKSLLINQQ